MKVLLVEGSPGLGAEAAHELVAAGHSVVGCDTDEPSAPCRGLELVGECPLDAGDVDVAVVSRSGGEFQPSERGALCASRHRVPVVLTGDPHNAVSFGPGTHLAGRDLAGAVESAASSGVAHEAAIRRDLLMSGAITSDDIDGGLITFSVRREPSRLRLEIGIEADNPNAKGVLKSAAEALRRFDRQASVIDVVRVDL